MWNLTYQCNLKCKHCYENAGEKERPELSTEKAKQVLDELSKLAGIGLPALSLSGGEPIHRKGLFEIAFYAKKRIGYVSIASNGTLITPDNARRIKNAGVDYVEISVDGATSEMHDRFRGIHGAFEKTMKGIKNCIKEGLDTYITTVLHRDNLTELDNLLNLAKQLDVRFMHFNYIPTGRAKGYVELDLTPDERLHVLETIGEELVQRYLKSEEELKHGKSNVSVDPFFSTPPNTPV